MSVDYECDFTSDDAVCDDTTAHSSKKTSIRSRIWRVVKVGLKLGLFIALLFHLYLLLLRFLPVPYTANMALRAAQSSAIDKEWVSINDISPNIIRAVIAAEDTQFCHHSGIDLQAIDKAMADNQRGGRRRGGSTITQQTAKNVFLWNGGGLPRKAAEAWYTLLIDRLWGKRRVMEVYLNVAEWGDGIYGIETAAQTRFGTSAKDLTIQQAAALASVLPNPNTWRLDPPGPYVQSRTQQIAARMGEVKAMGLDGCVSGR